ncbi:hypothetical protein EV175_003229 [Coemansia sp. RSA 1933]|nr:hypothetical protein EV175_003229 [Coemansia sp. RSA 1933]
MTTAKLRFDNRVVVITGAGGGLGKAYSLFFAARGGKVVVNDLGSGLKGEGSSAGAADLVVDEIRKAGGTAVADYHNVVTEGDKIIETAVKAFGRVDVIINNAGILRDKSFKSMSDQDWDSVLAVHLTGAYRLTQAAWPIMRAQKFGRIIMTASAAGIYGNFGQANYAAAKQALIGFSNSLALEGAKYNINSNAIAPLAASRMTATVMPQEMLDALKPEFIAPLVGYLTHETTKQTGGLFEIGAGSITAHRWEATRGVVFKPDAEFTPGAVKAQFAKVDSFDGGSAAVYYPASMKDNDWLGKLQEAKDLPPNQGAEALRFDGKVVLVTGAGNGLGRAYALMFGKAGAKVVVNDVATVEQRRAADLVVAEIKQAGGEAVANYDSVEDGDKVVQTAIDSFGRIDVVVNNAGILRDKSFVKVTPQEWDLVYRVHLRGTYKVSRAAWPHFMRQKGGAIINTNSSVGIFGNFGQTNYAAAKAGIQGLTNTLAIEGAKYGIRANAVAPNAGTAMTATVMPAEIVEMLKPEYVAPLVGYLAHESTPHSGKLFQVGSCWVSEIRRQRSGGVSFSVKRELTPEDIAKRWASIVDFDDGRAHFVANTRQSSAELMENAMSASNDEQEDEAEEKVDLVGAYAAKSEPQPFDYTRRDVVLYALGIGASRDDLPLVYENSDGFQTFPTFAVVAAFHTRMDLTSFLPSFNPMMLLHGEQFVEVHRPIPTEGRLLCTTQIVDIQDKGKGLTATGRLTMSDENGDVIAISESTSFIRGIGGFSKKPGFAPAKGIDRPAAAIAANDAPQRAPDAICAQKTSPEQAALYRLAGDFNPLHIDPAMSAMGGFKVPILHGLCTFGHAARHVVKLAAPAADASRLRSVKARFATPVYPGETLETSVWADKTAPNRVLFQVRVVERDVIAISNAAAEFTAPAVISSSNSSARL